MNIIIDIGNTRTKVGLFEDDKVVFVDSYRKLEYNTIFNLVNEYNIENGIICSTSNINEKIKKYLQSTLQYFIEFDSSTPLPIEVLYKSRNTLGTDRIAAVVGAKSIFPKNNNLIIDAGTAITYEFINDKEQYVGGNISPGLEIRFKSLNYFTSKLPLVGKRDKYNLIGQSTEEAIVNGVQNGLIFEIDSYIDYFKEHYNNLKIIITGGDSDFLANKLKNTIFVDKNLVLKGLNNILNHNINKK